jgi:heme O synthase-like polyprenyltransferase
MTVAYTESPALTGIRLADYLQLTRPRLCVMAPLTVEAGAVVAAGGAPDWRIMTHALVGAGLRASRIYLPALLTLWLLDGIPHGYNLPR